MGTPFLNIYDRALVVIQDFRLDNLYEMDYKTFILFMKGFLVNGIDLFNGCLVNLDYEDIEEEETIINEDGEEETITVTNSYFLNNLTTKEQSILAMIVVYNWFDRELQDVRQFGLHLTTRSFKVVTENQNFAKRSEHLDKLREKYLQEINNYQIENMDKLVAEIGGL